MTPELKATDRSEAAIRARSTQSILWAEDEISQRVSDVLWAATWDRRALLDALDAARAENARLRAALEHITDTVERVLKGT